MIGWSDHGDGVGVITLSRPPVNALDWKMKRSLDALLADLGDRDDVRSIVISSDLPRTFCAGSDLHELAKAHGRPGAAIERTRFEFEMWQRLSGLPQVSIAAIEGHALGSGLELAVACDFRVAGAKAFLGLPEIKIGGAPGSQVLARLPFLVGLGVARRMLLLGDSLSADAAMAAGLVDEVAAEGDALATALRLAQKFADQPRSSVRFMKSALSSAVDASLDHVELVVDAGVEALFLAPEMREGIAAFIEKRSPDFGTTTPPGETSET